MPGKSSAPGPAQLSKHCEVHLRKGESTDRLIKRFMKKVKNENIIKEYVESTYYEKPSRVRRKNNKKLRKKA